MDSSGNDKIRRQGIHHEVGWHITITVHPHFDVGPHPRIATSFRMSNSQYYDMRYPGQNHKHIASLWWPWHLACRNPGKAELCHIQPHSSAPSVGQRILNSPEPDTIMQLCLGPTPPHTLTTRATAIPHPETIIPLARNSDLKLLLPTPILIIALISKWVTLLFIYRGLYHWYQQVLYIFEYGVRAISPVHVNSNL